MLSLSDILEDAAEIQRAGIIIDIEKDTVSNNKFRKVIFTGAHLQLVLMSLGDSEEIGEEVHEDTDQFFRVDAGDGKLIMGNVSYNIADGTAFVIPAGVRHNVIAGRKGLKVYTLYGPPHHPAGTVLDKKEGAWSLMSDPAN